jgi:hypothetical protein
MKEGQEAIYYITADTLAAAKNSPQLEIFRKKGLEVLLLTDRVDEWMLSHLYEFEGKPLQSVAKGGVDLGKLQDEDEKKAAEATAEAFKPVLERLKAALKDRAKDVRTTTRLVDSPACIVVDEGDMSSHLARMLKQAGQTRAEVAADPGGQSRTCAGQAAGGRRALRRPGAGAVRPGPAGRRRPARGPGHLRAAHQPHAGRPRPDAVGAGAMRGGLLESLPPTRWHAPPLMETPPTAEGPGRRRSRHRAPGRAQVLSALDRPSRCARRPRCATRWRR